MWAQSSLIEHIKAMQYEDLKLCKLVEDVRNGKESEFYLDHAGVLRCGNHLCVPNVGDLRRTLLEETDSSGYMVHLGSTKLHQDLKQLFWWKGIKRDIALCVLLLSVSAS